MIKELIHVAPMTSKLAIMAILMAYQANGAVTLTGTKSYTFHFSTMGFVGISSAQQQSGFSLLLNGSDPTWSGGASWRIDLYDPFISDIVPFDSGPGVGAAIVSPDAWENLQGSGTITMLSGELTLDSIAVRRINSDGSRYGATVAIVPEPSTSIIGLMAICGLAFRRNRSLSSNNTN